MDVNAIRTGARVRAPELRGAAWLNTPHPLTLAGLRGRFVLLDFWTFCCANCLHVLDELRPLEAARSDVLTVVGVHSPKFPHEADPDALAAALRRHDLHHPVVADSELHLWRQYAVRAWPTLVLVDPEGYVVAQAAGEGQVGALAEILDRLVIEHETAGTLRRGDIAVTPPVPHPGSLRFPAKAITLPASRTGRDHDTLLVADAGHHQLVELATDGVSVLRRLGSGDRGRPFTEPSGVALLPAGLAPYDVVVADTAAHVLRGVRLSDGDVVATLDLPILLADARTVTGAVPSVLSPWDVVWWPAIGRLVVAAAGVHLLLALDPTTGVAEVLAGTTVEGLRDGPALDAWLAQPSGVAVDGDRLWFVDAETSALRHLEPAPGGGFVVMTAVGEGLFDFGHVDGPAAQARLQHPLGVTVLADDAVAVLDTYNGAVRRYFESVDGASVDTLATGLLEPSGAVLFGGELVVVESGAHRLVTPVPTAELVAAPAARTPRPVTELRAGTVELSVLFTPPPGRKLDHADGPPVRVSVQASPDAMLVSGAGRSSELRRTIELAAGIEGVLQVTAEVASCDDDTVAHRACYLSRQDWGVPVRVSPEGSNELRLTLLA